MCCHFISMLSAHNFTTQFMYIYGELQVNKIIKHVTYLQLFKQMSDYRSDIYKIIYLAHPE